MLLHRVIVRLLLIALCFHTVAGVPAHEAAHIRQRIAQAASAPSSSMPSPAPAPFEASAAGVVEAGLLAQEAGPGPGTGSHGGAAFEGLCAWCAAYAQVASALASPPAAAFAVAGAIGVAFPRPGIVFVPRPDRWRFASRDPPRAFPGRSSSSPSPA